MKFVMDIFISWLSNYQNLVRLTFLKRFHYLSEMDRRTYDKKQLPLRILKLNHHLLSIQDPTTGKTMMHTFARQSYGFPWNDFMTLYKMGARVDIEDFSGQTAMSLLSLEQQNELKQSQQTKTWSICGNVLNNLIEQKGRKRFWFLVKIGGAQPSAINNDGKSALDKLIEKLLEDYKAYEPYLKPISLDDHFNILKKLIGYLARLGKDESRFRGKDDQVRKTISLILRREWSLQKQQSLLNDPEYRNETPMHLAARLGFYEILEELVVVYPFPNVRSTSGSTLLHNVVIGLCQNRPGDESLTTKMDYLKCLEVLLTARAHIDHKDDQGKTPLHLLSEFKGPCKDYIEMMLSSAECFDVDVRNFDGMSPLHLASQRGNTDCVKVLLNAGAKPTSSNKLGVTPLHLACTVPENFECARLILAKIKRKVQIDVRDYEGRTPLHWACKEGHLDYVRMIVEKGGTVDACDDRGKMGKDLTRDQSILEFLESSMNQNSNTSEESDGMETLTEGPSLV